MNYYVVYGSIYGTAKEYAIHLAKQLEVDVVDYHNFVEPTASYGLVYIGGMYSGEVEGLKQIIKQCSSNKLEKLMIASVGLSDPDNQEEEVIRDKLIFSRVPKVFHNRTETFHLRGRVNYSKLSPTHQYMLRIIVNEAKLETIGAEENKVLAEALNKEIDLFDTQFLEPILQVIHNE